MNENDLPADDDSFTRARREDDDRLATAALRAGALQAGRAVASAVTMLICLNLATATALSHLDPMLAVYITLYGPVAIGVFYWGRGALHQYRALRASAKLPLWERHRVHLVLARIADRKETP